MGPRAALAATTLAVAVLLVGCDGANASNYGDQGAGGQDMAAGSSDLGASCVEVVVAATDPTTGAVTDHPPARLTATAQVSGARGAHWILSRAGDPSGVVPMPIDSTGLRVQYDVTDAGSWTFVVDFDSGPCRGQASITLKNPSGATMLYRFRMSPPETSGFPQTELPVSITGGQPLAQDLTLDPGTPVNGILRAGGAAIAGEVRLIADDGPDAVALAGSDGSFTLAVRPSNDYTPLLIPSSLTIAPHLGAKAKGATFLGASFDVPGGVAVTGTVVDGSAAPLGNANVVLRAGALPSGPGTTNGAGAFSLPAEPGTYALSFGATDEPQGALDGVVVPAGGTSVAISYTIARVAVGGIVVADDGTTPIADARVTVTSHALVGVADVSVGGGAASHAGGRVARTVTSGSDGHLPAMQLPPGDYDVIVEPPAPSVDGLTAFSETVTAAASWTLALARPVPLAIDIKDGAGNGVAGVRLTAIETAGLGAAPAAVTDGSGGYVFSIDKGAPIDLLVEPPASVRLAGTRLSLPAGGGARTIALGPGLPVTGVVRSPNGSTPQAGVRVEALCYACGSTTPLATSISDGSGVYRIYLPDPGNVVVDGGVD